MTTPRTRGAALFAASVLLHAAALLFLLDRLAPRHAADAADAIAVVWAMPVTEAVAPHADPAPLPKKPVAAASRSPTRGAPRRAPAPASAPASEAPLAAEVVAPAQSEPVFDRQAAMAEARRLAAEPDPTRAGTVGAELDKRRVYAETQDDKMGRTIASGKRSDCIKAQGNANLLTPLLWLLDKKGHGCKL